MTPLAPTPPKCYPSPRFLWPDSPQPHQPAPGDKTNPSCTPRSPSPPLHPTGLLPRGVGPLTLRPLEGSSGGGFPGVFPSRRHSIKTATSSINVQSSSINLQSSSTNHQSTSINVQSSSIILQSNPRHPRKIPPPDPSHPTLFPCPGPPPDEIHPFQPYPFVNLSPIIAPSGILTSPERRC